MFEEYEVKWIAAIVISLGVCAAIVGSFRAETETAAVKAGLVQEVVGDKTIWVKKKDDH